MVVTDFERDVGDQLGRRLHLHDADHDTTTTPAPTVTAVSPSTGVDTGGTPITITGTGFTSGATVKVGGTAATDVTVVSATSITATTPGGPDGIANVRRHRGERDVGDQHGRRLHVHAARGRDHHDDDDDHADTDGHERDAGRCRSRAAARW